MSVTKAKTPLFLLLATLFALLLAVPAMATAPSISSVANDAPDTEAPTIVPLEMTTVGSMIYSNGVFRVKATDSGSGIAKIVYSFGAETTDVPASPVGASEFIYDIPLVAADGETQVVAYGATDVAENVAFLSEPVKVTVDKSAPATIVTGAKNGSTSSKPVTLTFSAKDASSGVAFTEYSINGSDWAKLSASKKLSFPKSATYEVKYRSTDKASPAANVETEKTITFTVRKSDTVGPVTFGSNVTVKRGATARLRYRATDNASKTITNVVIVVKNSAGEIVQTIEVAGIKRAGFWYSTSFKATTRGVFRYYVYAKDSSGNEQSKVGSARIRVK